MPRPFTLTQRPRQRAVPIPVSPSEMDTCQALERQGVPHELIHRLVLPMARVARVSTPRAQGDALIRYLLEKATTGGRP